MQKLKLQGMRFGRLIALDECGTKAGRVIWRCQCDCGNISEVRSNDLRNLHTRSCGCLEAESIHISNLTHGMRYSREWAAWQEMKKRCLNQKHKSYNDYGGRGIQVCDRWLNSFENFFEDMGLKPSPEHSLDRIETNGDYTRENCRWATANTQANNKRTNHILVFNGEELTIAQWAKRIGIRGHTILMRLKRGWDVGDALSLPIRKAIRQ